MFSAEDLARLVSVCRPHDSWLVVDQTYHEFLFDGASHSYPCSRALTYPKIVHIFSFSKAFGMPGWRVGYAVYPQALSAAFRKVRLSLDPALLPYCTLLLTVLQIQDSIPTHATILSQQLALLCMGTYEGGPDLNWVADKVTSHWPDMVMDKQTVTDCCLLR